MVHRLDIKIALLGTLSKNLQVQKQDTHYGELTVTERWQLPVNLIHDSRVIRLVFRWKVNHVTFWSWAAIKGNTIERKIRVINFLTFDNLILIPLTL